MPAPEVVLDEPPQWVLTTARRMSANQSEVASSPTMSPTLRCP